MRDPGRAETFGLLEEKVLENLSQEFVLAKQLMNRRLLAMPELAQFAGLVDHGGVRGDLLLGGCSKVGGDLPDQGRDVIEQLIRRKHFVHVHRQQMVQPMQPACSERGALAGDTVRHDARIILGSSGNVHRCPGGKG